MPTLSGYTGNGGGGSGSDGGSNPGTPGERGYRRKRLAAMAGSLYRTGASAVNEIKESYAQTRVGDLEPLDGKPRATIPGSFPGVAITVQGDDQMVIFPSYAKRHVKQDWAEVQEHQSAEPGSINDPDYWRKEWERNEDEKAIVDIDVRGWIYSPHKGPMTRRNRILIGLARQLSGIPRPDTGTMTGGEGSLAALHETHEERKEQEKIARKAAEIEKKGQEEKRVANRGGYSETPKEDSGDDGESIYPARSRSRSRGHTPASPPGSPQIPARQYTASELTESELSVANANLMARIAPFMTTPLVEQPITIFFYNDESSQSRTVTTNDAGHFIIRASLDFVPTHVRVLANESLSATQEVKIIEPKGVSLISDIDDTIKRSNISAGAKEIFRNTFIRELHDLTVEGVREWYNEMHAMGVSIHYCSNSPWQLFPVLASYFMIAGLPPGSLHLKQYSGMLQGIFEPVAERKKSTLTRLMRDFPERKFLLVGDSGEADLEVYTELVVAHPDRIIAVFIRDVTTPEQAGFFDSSFESSGARRKSPSIRIHDPADDPASRPGLPPRTTAGPVMGNLIDFSDEPEQGVLDDAAALAQLRHDQPKRSVSSADILGRRPPPRPVKPAALRSAPSDTSSPVGLGLNMGQDQQSNSSPQSPMPRSRNPSGDRSNPHPLSQMHNSSQQTVGSNAGTPRKLVAKTAQNEAAKTAPTPPPPRRRETPSSVVSLSPRQLNHKRAVSSNSDVDYEALPPSAAPPPPALMQTKSKTTSGGNTPTMGSPTLGAVNKKVELWKRRLSHAHEILDSHGVALYTWRRGDDVVAEAVGLVKEAMKSAGGSEKDATKEGKKFEKEWKQEQKKGR